MRAVGKAADAIALAALTYLAHEAHLFAREFGSPLRELGDALLILGVLAGCVLAIKQLLPGRLLSLSSLSPFMIFPMLYLSVLLGELMKEAWGRGVLYRLAGALPTVKGLPVAMLILSLLVIKVRPLRGDLASALAHCYTSGRGVALGLILAAIYAVLGRGGLSFVMPRLNVVQMMILGGLAFMGVYAGVMMLAKLAVTPRRGGGGRRVGEYRVESWPPIKRRIAINGKFYDVYLRQAGLRTRAYLPVRVLGGRVDTSRLDATIRAGRKLIIYYHGDGMLYLVTVGEAFRPLKAVQRALSALRGLGVDHAPADGGGILEVQRFLRETIGEADVAEEVARVNPFEKPGVALVIGYWGRERREGPYGEVAWSDKARIGLYKLDESGERTSVLDVRCHESVAIGSAVALVEKAFREALPVSLDAESPLVRRVGHEHLEGVRLSIPVECHMGLFGITGSGKSTAIAQLIRYVLDKGNKVLVLDWVGDFTGLKDAVVVRPGEDIYLDVFGTFGLDDKIELLREAVVLHFRRGEHMFTPIVESVLERVLANSGSFAELKKNLEVYRERAPERDERQAAAAALRRIGRMRPELYDPEPGKRDLTEVVEESDLVVVDLSEHSDEDKVMFTLTVLKALMSLRSRRIGERTLYVVVDEAHRIAPEYMAREYGEFILERLAREARKHGIWLILGNQTISSLKREVVSNLGTVFLFRITGRRDIDEALPWFSAWAKEDQLTDRQLMSRVADALGSLNPGECFMIGIDPETGLGPKPVPAYFTVREKLARPAERLDWDRFREVVERFPWPPTAAKEHRKVAVRNARMLIRRYGRQLLSLIAQGIERAKSEGRAVELDGVVVVRDDGEPTLTARLILAYYRQS